MKQFKTILYSLILLCLFILIGNSININKLRSLISNSNISNSARKNSLTIFFDIKNQTNSEINYITIKSQSGLVVYQNNLECKADNRCSVKIDKQKINGDLYFEFMRANSKIVSIYTWKYEVGNQFRIFASDTMLGIYAFHQMKIMYSIDPKSLLSDLSNLFKNYNNADIFQELGLYFKLQMNDGLLTEEQFYRKLESEISAKVILSKDLIPQPANLSRALSSESLAIMPVITSNVSNIDPCSTPEINYILSIFVAISSVIPDPLFQTIIYYILSITNSTLFYECAKRSKQDIIDDLYARIDEIDKKLIEINYKIIDLYNHITKVERRSIEKTFAKDMRTFRRTIDVYNTPFRSESGPDGTKSLLEFAQKNGGVKNLIDNEHNYSFQKALSSTAEQIDSFNEIMITDLADLANSIKFTCNDPNTITGDVLAERIGCILVINYVVTNTAISAKQLKSMLGDEIDTALSVRTKSGDFDKDWFNKRGIHFYYNKVAWENASKFVDELIDKKIKEMNKVLLENGQTLKDLAPLKDFPPELAASMESHSCFSEESSAYLSTKSQPKRIPNVIKWYPNTPDGKPYIVTNCYNGESEVKSLYYLKGGYKVNNILGALMPGISPVTIYSNYWPNKVGAAVISIPDITDYYGRSTAQFTLISQSPYGVNYPIKISSSEKAVRHYAGQGVAVAPTLDFVTPGYGPVYPAYWSCDQFKPFDWLRSGSADMPSFFLIPIVLPTGEKSKDTFTSTIYNGSDGVIPRFGSKTQCYVDRIAEIIYLSFEKNKVTYVFGLQINNEGIFKDDAGHSYRATQYVSLLCLTNTLCNAKGNGIIWNDGTYADLLNINPNTISLAIESK